MNRMFEMERKVTKFGNSLGITMTDALKQIGLDQGDIVNIDVTRNQERLLLRSQQKLHYQKGLVQIS